MTDERKEGQPVRCLTGASYPCSKCGVSHRNTVHRNKTQFGYHEYVERPAAQPQPRGSETLREVADDILLHAHTDVLAGWVCIPIGEWEGGLKERLKALAAAKESQT